MITHETKRVVALGNFDGLHRGHMRVLEKACQEAACLNMIPSVLLFDVHPQTLIGKKAPDLLMTDSDRNSILTAMGLNIIAMPFASLREMNCSEFVSEVLADKLNAGAVCCGFNYRFGKAASGDVSVLESECKKNGIRVLVADEEDFNSSPVSSTRIRRALLDGKPIEAAQMLGRPFSYCLNVIHGDARGRTIGFPTINQQFSEGLLVPKHGVYASSVETHGKTYPGVTNVGVRPTVGGGILLSETCILGFSGDLYNHSVRVSLLEYLRDEIAFSDFKDLKKQISSDAEHAEMIYEKYTKQTGTKNETI